MKRKITTKITCVFLTVAMLVLALSGCGSPGGDGRDPGSGDTRAQEAEGGIAAENTSGQEKYPEFLTIEVFGSQSNYQGLQSGWFAKIVKDKFNMELNIIAPNVAGGGDTLYQTRSANGNLGDLILLRIDQNKLRDLVQAELVLDMTDYLDGCENLKQYLPAIEMASALAGKEGIWGIPSSISLVSAMEPDEISEPTGAASLRWDLYKEVGYPEIKSLDDLLPVLKQMQELAGTSNSGKDVYGFSLFGDWDGDIMQNAGAFAAMYGYDYDGGGYGLLNVMTGEIQSMIEDGSLYIDGLRLLFKANQMGLVDPESTTQNFDTLSSKYKDGAVLFSLWPWLGTGQYNSQENKEAGKGFMSVAIEDAKYLCWGSTPAGNTHYGLMIGSQTKDPQRMVDFVDWLYSPEGIAASGSTDTCGPEGLTWELKDGKPVFTDFGRQVLIEKDQDAQVPEEWGGGTYNDGISALNYSAVGQKDKNEENGVPYLYELWDEYREITSTELNKDWMEHYGTGKLPIDYFAEQDMISVIPGTAWAKPDYPTDVTVIKEQCKQTIVDYSWRMIFAESEEEFDSLLKEMQEIAYGLGYEQVLEVDRASCAARYQLLEEARKQ